MTNDHRKKCKHCKHEIEQVNYILGREWMHVNPSTSFPTTHNGGYWSACRLTSAEPLEEKDEKNYQFAEEVARRAGLPVRMCFELLTKGWRYVERVNEISRWEHPMWRME